MASAHKSLGRGLGSIISGGVKKPDAPKQKAQVSTKEQKPQQAKPAELQTQNGLFSEILIDKISFSPYQARKEFSEEQISQLADSIASEGLMQPASCPTALSS